MKKIGFFFYIILCANMSFAQNILVNFQGDITNKNGNTIYIKDDNYKTIKEIKLDHKGRFESSFEIKDGFYEMFDGVEVASLYLKGGYDLHLKMDAKQFDETLVFSGKGADENNFLAQNLIGNEVFMAQNKDKEFDDFYKVFDEKKKADYASLESANFDSVFKERTKKTMSQDFLSLQMEYKKAQAAKKMIGKPSMSFDFENHAGGKTKLDDLKGKYVYIDVWATWCGPCRTELPHLKKIEEKYHGKNIAFVSISVDETKDLKKWKTFVKDKKLGGIQLFADANFDSEFIKSYKINSIPRFILIDPDGLIVNPDADRPSNPKLQEQLDKLLK